MGNVEQGILQILGGKKKNTKIDNGVKQVQKVLHHCITLRFLTFSDEWYIFNLIRILEGHREILKLKLQYFTHILIFFLHKK